MAWLAMKRSQWVPLFFAVAVFLLAMLTTSQSATTRTLVPIGLTVLGVGQVVAMWSALSGVLFLPANGTQLAAVAVDETGTTKIGKAVVTAQYLEFMKTKGYATGWTAGDGFRAFMIDSDKGLGATLAELGLKK